MIRSWARYVAAAYPPRLHVPVMLLWSAGLTALYADTDPRVARWRPGAGLALTAATLVVDMLLLRALDDLRDHAFDREHHPERPLPAGLLSERQLRALIAVGVALVLAANAWRGTAVLILAAHLGYTVTAVAVDRLAGRPRRDAVMAQLAVNLPIQPLLSLYVYAAFLRDAHLGPRPGGVADVLVVSLAALCLEFGRKASRRTRPGGRTYSTVLGPLGTSTAAVACAFAAAAIALAGLRPWQGGTGAIAWGWLVVLPTALPTAAAVRFAAGAVRWPVAPTLLYLPALYLSFVTAVLLAKGMS